jgi:hypothetical protein
MSINLQNNILDGNGSLLFKDQPFVELYFKSDDVNIDALMSALTSLTPNVTAQEPHLDDPITGVAGAKNAPNNINVKDFNPLQMVLMSLGSKMEFKANHVKYKNKTYDNVNYSVFLKNGNAHYVPCMPVWIKELNQYLNAFKLTLTNTEKTSKSEAWCQ